ncbi:MULTISPECIES: hypothetical protein [unclassified Hyphomonas]|jgi:hypothetical protein|uniref:hypothetical protein n=1 Tax=unclassified Hyphomonas TaxID=2630699 RepID=UPI000C65C722|nr:MULTISPECIES: hypothetical protein [unclassified Hyphomonas]MAN91055.1 hypothetical protein [Hyphomonadaceae bacterium]MAL45064.1 hypothetical protein [Hyphomonas sp.]MAX83716.1 hypothetical protein [Hyphomonas sp.]HAO37262.1 hypothetical protein [Hyphomonas sp.]HAQ76031.1 hypothetical protein [Hyphomonas sp.]|tara:strand:- start:294 stop:947 length:654 start_codon:yes stop_codon:yes gene_type:complete
MTRTSLIALGVLFLAGNAHAIEEQPESCRPKVAGSALALADDADQAQLQCDIDRAALIADRADATFDSSNDPILRIVDTAAPSGAAYVYDIVDADGTMMLDARTVPVDSDTNTHIPLCRLQTQLPAPVASKVALSLLTTSDAGLPAYGAREKMVVNADGSRSYELLLASHDIITSIETTNGLKQFSRHSEATDIIAELNRSVIGVANFSDGWVCKSN